jgi:hypothetical protein
LWFTHAPKSTEGRRGHRPRLRRALLTLERAVDPAA